MTASPSLRAEAIESDVLTPAAGNPSFCGYTCLTTLSCPEVFMAVELQASPGGAITLSRL